MGSSVSAVGLDDALRCDHVEGLRTFQRSDARRALAWLTELLESLSVPFHDIFDGKAVLVRSSAVDEGLGDRGQLTSLPAVGDTAAIAKAIHDCWTMNQGRLKDDRDFPVVVQRAVQKVAEGHLSNERRVSKRHDSWLVEVLDLNGELRADDRIRPVHARDEAVSELLVDDPRNLVSALRPVPLQNPPSPYSVPGRRHYEWAWDGSRIWILQCDFEPTYGGEPPNSDWSGGGVGLIPELNCFIESNEASSRWGKVRCVEVFRACDLPTGRLFVLEERREIEQIIAGRISPELQSDIAALTSLPLVIRTDIDRSLGKLDVLLPRTDTCSSAGEAIQFS